MILLETNDEFNRECSADLAIFTVEGPVNCCYDKYDFKVYRLV